MRRNPLYIFNNLEAIGLDQVPLDSTIQINDIDGDDGNGISVPMIIQLVSKDGIDSFTTIEQLLLMTDNYVDINQSSRVDSELEKITQVDISGIEHTGWRILGRDPLFYGIIGREGIDLTASPQSNIHVNNYGATGIYSLAAGYRTTASGWGSTTFGHYTLAKNNYSFACGSYNKGEDTLNLIEFGCGVSESDRKNALEVTTDGLLIAPEMSIQVISGATNPQILATREYSDLNVELKYNKTGGIIGGNVYIAGNNPTAEESLINNGWASFKQGVSIDKSLTVGGDIAGSSEIKFVDTNPANSPAITWQSGEFFITTNSQNLQRIWHAGNGGKNSGLDADMIWGINGEDLVTQQDLHDGLLNKVSKAGDTMTGDLVVEGYINVIGNLKGTTLEMASNALIEGRLDVTGDVTFDSPLTLNSTFYPSTIDSEPEFKRGAIFSGINTTTVDSPFIFFNDNLRIGENSSLISGITFRDHIAGYRPRLYWDSTSSAFFINGADNVPHKVYHDGLLPPGGGVTTFDALTDTPVNKIGYDGFFLKVQGADIVYEDISSFSPTWGNISGVLANQSDLDTALLGKLNTSGGTITTITVTGSASINSNLTVTGVAEILDAEMETITGDVNFIDSVVIDNSLVVSGPSTTEILNLGYYTDGNSSITFKDDGTGTGVIFPKIYWDNTNHDFRYDDATGLSNPLTQSNTGTGGLDPTLPVEFESSVLISSGPFTTKDINILGTTILLEGDATVGEAGLQTKHYPDGVLEAGVVPRLFWDSNQSEWAVDGATLNSGSYTPYYNSRLWNSINFNPSTKFDKAGGIIVGDVSIEADPGNPPLVPAKNGDLSVAGDLSVGNNITSTAILSTDLDINGSTNFSGVGNPNSTFTIASDIGVQINATSVNFSGLPTTDPGVPGLLWQDTTTGQLMISQ